MNKQTEALNLLKRAADYLQDSEEGDYNNRLAMEIYAYLEELKACKEALELSEKQHTISDKDHPAPSWLGLSDDEMMKIIEACEDKFDRHLLGGIMIARAIEQALKEKNHG